METLLLKLPKTKFVRKSKNIQEWLFWIRNRYAFSFLARKYKCTHPFPPRIVVINSAVTCETTVEVCPCCGGWLSEPETDC